MTGSIALDSETADNITYLTLKEHLSILQEQMDKHINNGEYMHSDDFKLNKKFIGCLEILIEEYFEL
jgi:hypothetical protein